MSTKALITGTGHFVPPEIVTNFDLEKKWTPRMNGFARGQELSKGAMWNPFAGSSGLVYEAALRAIEAAEIDKSEIDFIIATTLSPDHYFPGIGVIVQAKLGLSGIGALDSYCNG